MRIWLLLGMQSISACTSLSAPSSIKAQYPLLYSSNASERCAAVYDVGKLGSQAAPAVPRLVRLLEDDAVFPLPDNGLDGPFTSTPAQCASEALVQIGEPSVVPLIPLLKHSKPEVRVWTASVLGTLRDPRSAQAMRAAFKDPDARVRRTVVVLAGNADPSFLDGYIAALKDRDSEVRLQAGRTIGIFHEPREIDVLLDMLAHSKDVDAQVSAAMMLGSIKDARIRPALLNGLKDPNDAVRAHSALSLGDLGDKESVEPLLVTLRDDPDITVRFAATEALGRLRDLRALEPLIVALKSDNFVQRKVAAEALGKLGDPRAIAPLQPLLNDEQPVVRESARQALLVLKSP